MRAKSLTASVVLGAIVVSELSGFDRQHVRRFEQPHDHHDLVVEYVDVTSPLSFLGGSGQTITGQFTADAFLVQS